MRLQETAIEGLVVLDLDLHEDNRGWFKENWQREKMVKLGLPDFRPVQNNISFNVEAGVTRGLHAEPWDKLVSVASGKVYGAWCDLRQGSKTYGETFSCEIAPDRAVFVPRGVANGFQSLEKNTAYTYLVNDHWRPQAEYSFVNLETIDWPLPISEMSEKDKNHPSIEFANPVKPLKTVILGSGGQLGEELKKYFPEAISFDRNSFNLVNPPLMDWSSIGTIINAAAYTNVDLAESESAEAWKVNAQGAANLAKIAIENNLLLVHVSSDYVFGGEKPVWTESDSVSPLNSYGYSKAAGDLVVATVPKHYLVRTSWVIGSGKNFVKTMSRFAREGVSPSVVDDQTGRLSFVEDIAIGIRHLIDSKSDFGTYNLTNAGDSVSWAEIAREVFQLLGENPNRVNGISTEEYLRNREAAIRPANSSLDLSKIQGSGYYPRDWRAALAAYLKENW